MINRIHISEWLAIKAKGVVVLDARSPGEFEKGHIPGAMNLPLLDNEERHLVGLCYKKNGHDEAVKLGFELAGAQFIDKIRSAEILAPHRELLIYCWRGGLRSQIMAWLLSTSGFNVELLEGGYKSFRNEALTEFTKQRVVYILGGKTGAGKTEVLQFLNELGEQIIDLEGLGSHKGSSFGSLGLPTQPSQEHFENMLALELMKVNKIDHALWIEDESRFIGKVRIPDSFYSIMVESKIIFIDRSTKSRAHRILGEYGSFPVEILAERTAAIAKRMGPEQSRDAVNALLQGNQEKWVELLLDYYDKSYNHSLLRGKRQILLSIECENQSAYQIANQIISSLQKQNVGN
ncbi:MAG: tRNA 2-selenouridine(34) synthase MnmH [Flavobacteriales bacterium]|nr:tRNA 2-selenouridine(34) synthase MnmH [Flavobacteriales bacterium]